MRCQKCGAEIPNNAAFCKQCGTKVEHVAPPAAAAPVAAKQAPSAASSARPASSVAVGAQGSNSRPANSATPTFGSQSGSADTHTVKKMPVAFDVERFRKYFDPKSIGAYIAMIVIGALLLIIGSKFGMVFVLIGVVLIVVGIIAIAVIRGGTATDAEVDAAYNTIENQAQGEVLDVLGIDESTVKDIDPLVFSGRSISDDPASVHTRIGNDGVLRTSNFQTSVIYPGKDQIYLYSSSQSITINKRRVGSDDIFYNDIVTLSVVSDYSSGGAGGIGSHSFRIITSAGNDFSVAYNENDVNQRAQMESLRSQLRLKKNESVAVAKEQLKEIKAISRAR